MGVENDKKDFDLAYVTKDITLWFSLLYTLWVFTIETWRVSIADSCTFYLYLTCDKSLSKGFIPINTLQQRAATPLKPTIGHRLQVKIYRR